MDKRSHGRFCSSHWGDGARMMESISHARNDRSISVGRDAFGNIFVTGDRNDVRVTLVVADQRLASESTGTSSQSVPADSNPYRGLDAFYENDAPFFFGRQRLVQRAWVQFQRLQHDVIPRILAVVGASGSGKSSLVRAGLIPELAREPMAGLHEPKVLILRPGPSPLDRLADVLERLPGIDDGPSKIRTGTKSKAFDTLHISLAKFAAANQVRAVIVVDQFEELFTECKDSEARDAFLEYLTHAVCAPDKFASVVITLRSDFVGAIKKPSAFATAVHESRLQVRAMDRDELVQAISEPARAMGYSWPAPIVENLVAQAEGRSGALPLLEFALKRLWPQLLAGKLSDAGWSSWLIEDFLVEAAEALFEANGSTDGDLSPRQQIIRRAFLSMVQLGEGTPDTRRVARLSDLVANGEDNNLVVQAIVPFTAPEARLVTASEQGGEPTFELTHEALIGSWGRLRTWLGNVADKRDSERIRADLRLHRRLSTTADDWNRGQASLWRSSDLIATRDYIKRNAGDLTAVQRNFLAASKRRAHLEWWVMRGGLALIVVLAVASAALAIFADQQKFDAISQRRIAERRALDAEEATRNADAQQAIAVNEGKRATEAARRADEQRAVALSQRNQALIMRSRLLASLARSKIDQNDIDLGTLLAVEAMPRDRSMVHDGFADANEALLYAVKSDRRYLDFEGFDDTRATTHVIRRGAVFTSDDQRVAIATYVTGVQIFDFKLRKLVAFLLHDRPILDMAMAPDNRLLAVATEDAKVTLWSMDTYTKVSSLSVSGTAAASVRFSPDGKRLLVGSGGTLSWRSDSDKSPSTVSLFDLASGRLLWARQTKGTSVRAVDIDVTGRFALSGSDSGAVDLWSMKGGDNVASLTVAGKVLSGGFSSDGRQLLVASKEMTTAQVWQVGNWTSPKFEMNHGNTLGGAVYAPNGDFIATYAGEEKDGDFNPKLWDARSGAALRVLQGSLSKVTRMTFSHSSRTLFAATKGGQIHFWDVETGQLKGSLPTSDKRAAAIDISLSRNDRFLYVTLDGRAGRLWDIKDPMVEREFPKRFFDVSVTALSSDGKLLATLSADAKRLTINNTSSGHVIYSSNFLVPALSIGFDPTSTKLRSILADGSQQRFDLRPSGMEHRSVDFKRKITRAVFAAHVDRHCFITEGDELWFGDTDAEPAKIASGLTNVNNLTISPDGSQIAVVMEDGSLRIWQFASAFSARPTSSESSANGKVTTMPFTEFRLAADSFVRRGLYVSDASPKVSTVQFDRTGQLVLGTTDGLVFMWHAQTGKITPIASEPAVSFHVSTGSNKVVLLTTDDTLVLVDLNGLGVEATWKRGPSSATSGTATSFLVSGDGSAVAAKGGDGSISVWRPFDPKPTQIHALRTTGRISNVSSDASRIIVETNDHYLALAGGGAGGKTTLDMGGASGNPVFYANGDKFAVPYNDGTMGFLDTRRTGDDVFVKIHSRAPERISSNAQGTHLLAVYGGGDVGIIDTRSLKQKMVRGINHELQVDQRSPSGERGIAALFSLKRPEHQSPQLSDRTGYVLSGHGDGFARIWDADGELLNEIKSSGKVVNFAAWCKDGRHVLLVVDWSTVEVWEWQSQKRAFQSPVYRPGEIVRVGVIGPEAGFYIASSNRVYVWDGPSGSIRAMNLKHPSGQELQIRDVLISPEGSTLAAVDSNDNVSVWDTANGAFKREFVVAGVSFTELAFDKSGSVLGAIGHDGANRTVVRIWSTAEEISDGLDGVFIGHLDGQLAYSKGAAAFFGVDTVSGDLAIKWEFRVGSQLLEYAAAGIPRKLSIAERREFKLGDDGETEPKANSDDAQLRCDMEAGHPLDVAGSGRGAIWDAMDGKTAVEVCERALSRDLRNPRLLYQYGRSLKKIDRDADALMYLRAASERGYTVAQALLGQSYLYGEGIARNVDLGVKWLRQAADAGDPVALEALGKYLVFNGHSEVDSAKGLELMRQAAAKRNPTAYQFFAQQVETNSASAAREEALLYYLKATRIVEEWTTRGVKVAAKGESYVESLASMTFKKTIPAVLKSWAEVCLLHRVLLLRELSVDRAASVLASLDKDTFLQSR